MEEEQNQFDESRARLSETFQGLAGEALKSNNQAFLELATQTLETLRAQGVGDLDQRKEAIQALVTPLSESLIIRPMASVSTTWNGGGKQPTGT